jgi:histidinol-phosphatase
MPENLLRFLDVAIAAATAAGRRTLAHFDPGIAVSHKGDDSPVTVADREAETLLRDALERAFPQHGIVGEEYGATRPGASHQWFVDPIDGTRSFVRGVPLYAVLVGLEIDGRVEVGVANFPALGETLAAASGQGTRLNGRRVWVRDTPRLAEAFASFTDAASFATYGRGRAWRAVQAATAFRPGWSDAYGHALVASGRVEVMLDPVMNAWDCGPFPVLLREAGGFFGDWSGVETIHGGEAVSCSQVLWPELAPLLALRDAPATATAGESEGA